MPDIESIQVEILNSQGIGRLTKMFSIPPQNIHMYCNYSYWKITLLIVKNKAEVLIGQKFYWNFLYPIFNIIVNKSGGIVFLKQDEVLCTFPNNSILFIQPTTSFPDHRLFCLSHRLFCLKDSIRTLCLNIFYK